MQSISILSPFFRTMSDENTCIIVHYKLTVSITKAPARIIKKMLQIMTILGKVWNFKHPRSKPSILTKTSVLMIFAYWTLVIVTNSLHDKNILGWSQYLSVNGLCQAFNNVLCSMFKYGYKNTD